MKSQLYVPEMTRRYLKSEISSYIEIYFQKLLPVSKDIENDADRYANDFYDNFMSQPAYDDFIDPSSIAERALEILLSKKNIETGKSLQNAEAIHKDKLKDKAIQDALPEAWNRIIEEPDPLLVELLAERTERICSYKTELSAVSKFLKSCEPQFLLLPPEEQIGSEHPKQSERHQKTSSPQEPSNDQKISQDALIPHIVRILKKHGSRTTKEQVEKEIFALFRTIFEHPWYQEKVSTGVPRWQHNVAWAKERAKRSGLIKKPSESGRGYWQLTDKGMKFL